MQCAEATHETVEYPPAGREKQQECPVHVVRYALMCCKRTPL